MSKRDHNKELEALYDKAKDELTHLKKENTFKGPKTRARDVMVHIAVTIMNEYDGRQVAGERENEIGQFAVRIPAVWIQKGLTAAQCQKMFEELTYRAYERMRVSGLTRE